MTRFPTRRRALLRAAAAVAALAAPALAQERSLRIGYQKYGTLVLLYQLRLISSACSAWATSGSRCAA